MNEHTPMANSSIHMHEAEHFEKTLIHFVRERLGIIIHPHQINDLQKVIKEACKKFNITTNEYFKLLNEASDNSPLIEDLIIRITIGETYFFRDSNQMRLLQNQILPDLIKKKRQEENYSLRIWSAGCSSGEEIYTIAMLLCDMLPDIKAWTLHLLATDINTNALKKALAGVYGEWSMRSIAERYKQRYFTVKNQQYVLSEAIRDMVTFLYLNLNDDSFPSILNETNAQDLIICRNVLIYFDRDRGAHLMQKFSASLSAGGSIMLGASDPIYTTDTDLIFHYQQGTLFTRPTEEELKKVKTTIPHEVAPQKKTVVKSSKIMSKTHPIKPVIEISKPESLDEQKTLINKLLSEGRWQETLDTIHFQKHDIIKSAFLLSAEGTALANLGKLDKAADFCYQSLKMDSTNIDTHFTLAMVLVELNRIKDAEAELRKTLFLDHQFVMGHFQLGLLLLKNKQHEMGLKCLNNALAIVKSKDPNALVPGFNKIYYGHLAEILEHEIEMHVSSKGLNNALKKT